ncbi:hypothetical protein HZB97_03380 [Candidatus Gottesmanbacteria bacterium]|nr:hypothetical protein [Candidatus Gottesmanbacteria bacterium]
MSNEFYGDLNREISLSKLRGRGFWKKIENEEKTFRRFLNYVRVYRDWKLEEGGFRDIPSSEIKISQQDLANFLKLLEAGIVFGWDTIYRNPDLVHHLEEKELPQQTTGYTQATIWQTVKDLRGPFVAFRNLYHKIFGSVPASVDDENIRSLLFHDGEAVLHHGFEEVIQDTRKRTGKKID